ncbi:MAG: oligosaccharide flippase family protein [bacterium]
MTRSAPAGGIRTILEDVAGFASSQYALRIGSLIKGFAVARILGPAGNGIWQHFALIFDYSQFAHLGILPGYNKVMGHRLGRGDEAGVMNARDNGLAGVFVSAVAVWIGLCLYAWLGKDLDPIDRWGLPILGAIVVLEQITNTYKALLRAYSRIKLISVVSVAFASTNLVLSLALLPGFKMFGVMVAWVVTRLGTTLWLIARSGAPFRLKFEPATMRALLVTGFPIYLYQLTRLVLRNVDRVLVDATLPKEDLGIYGIAVTMTSLVRYGADAIGFVLYPVILRIYGETADPMAPRDHLVKPTLFLALFVPIVLGFGCLVVGAPVRWILPAYEQSIGLFRLLSVPMVFSCLAIMPGFYMMAIDRQNWLVPLGFASIALNWYGGTWAVDHGYGMSGVAVVTGANLALNTAAMLLISGRHALGSWMAATVWTAKTFGPVLWVAAVIVGIDWVEAHTSLGQLDEVPRDLIEGLAFLAVSVPLLVAFERKTRFVRNFRRRRRGPPPPAGPASS